MSFLKLRLLPRHSQRQRPSVMLAVAPVGEDEGLLQDLHLGAQRQAGSQAGQQRQAGGRSHRRAVPPRVCQSQEGDPRCSQQADAGGAHPAQRFEAVRAVLCRQRGRTDPGGQPAELRLEAPSFMCCALYAAPPESSAQAAPTRVLVIVVEQDLALGLWLDAALVAAGHVGTPGHAAACRAPRRWDRHAGELGIWLDECNIKRTRGYFVSSGCEVAAAAARRWLVTMVMPLDWHALGRGLQRPCNRCRPTAAQNAAASPAIATLRPHLGRPETSSRPARCQLSECHSLAVAQQIGWHEGACQQAAEEMGCDGVTSGPHSRAPLQQL